MLRGAILLALVLAVPARAGDGINWKKVESRVKAVEKAKPTCATAKASDTSDAVAAIYASLQDPLTRKDATVQDYSDRIRATMLVRRVATAGSHEAHTLEACGDAQAGFVAWQLDSMAQTMDHTALAALDAAVAALGTDPAHDLCSLLPSKVAAQRPKLCT